MTVWVLDRFGPGAEEVELVDLLTTHGLAPQWLNWDDLTFGAGGALWHRGEPVPPPAAAVVRSRVFTRTTDLAILLDCLRLLERAGVRLINSAEAIASAHNKVSGVDVLAGAGVPVPATRLVRTIEEAGRCLLDWSEVVFKPVTGHATLGVLLMSLEPRDTDDTPPGISMFQEMQLWHMLRHHQALCAQEFVAHPGPELRVLYIDGEIVACNRRTLRIGEAGGDRGLGGQMTPAACTDEIVKVTVAAAEALGLAHAAVDILEAERGLVVLEANPMISRWREIDRLGLHLTEHGVGRRLAGLVARTVTG
jgi:tetrahydromethanopterin:alpha-L-glutamate ligase